MPDREGLTFIGFGEAARAFASGWRGEHEWPISAYDIRSAQPAHGQEMAEAWARADVTGFDDIEGAVTNARIVMCLVTADQAVQAAEAASPYLIHGTLWLDGNSCSPGAKRHAANVIEAAGGLYVDMAIMSPVHPRLHRTPIILSGAAADRAAVDLATRGTEATVVGGEVGRASSIKMLRSVMVKGIEALTAECLLAARKAGVEDVVLASLQGSDPGSNWPTRARYNLERMRVHGRRRAAEMREVVVTLEELGLPARLSAATAEWQDQLGGIDTDDEELAHQLDSILSHLK